MLPKTQPCAAYRTFERRSTTSTLYLARPQKTAKANQHFFWQIMKENLPPYYKTFALKEVCCRD
jgi:hypothetical protein